MIILDRFSHNGLCFTIRKVISEEWKISFEISACKDNSDEFQLKNETIYREKLNINFSRWDYGRGSLTFADENSERLFLEECYDYGIGFEMIRLIGAGTIKQEISL